METAKRRYIDEKALTQVPSDQIFANTGILQKVFPAEHESVYVVMVQQVLSALAI